MQTPTEVICTQVLEITGTVAAVIIAAGVLFCFGYLFYTEVIKTDE